MEYVEYVFTYLGDTRLGFDDMIRSEVITIVGGRLRRLAWLSPLAPPERARRALSNGVLAVFELEHEGAQQFKECLKRASKRMLRSDHR